MHGCRLNPYVTFLEAFLTHLCHLSHKGGNTIWAIPTLRRGPLSFANVSELRWKQESQQRTGADQLGLIDVAVQRGMTRFLVGLGQPQCRCEGSRKEGRADQQRGTSWVVHQPAVEGLDWPEVVHHRLAVVELDHGESFHLQEKIDANVELQIGEKDSKVFVKI